MQKWHESLFENYAEKYDNESFTQGTIGECDFLEQELNSDNSLKILDVGCGTGRHAIEMTKRGYQVNGVDLSENQLSRARKKTAQAGFNIDFQKQDARKLPFNEKFDVAIMLYEGGFPLMEKDEMNFEILKSVTNSLKQPGKFVFTTLNGLFPLFNSIEKFTNAESKESNAWYHSNSSDLMTFRDYNITEFEDDLLINCIIVVSHRIITLQNLKMTPATKKPLKAMKDIMCPAELTGY